MEYSLDRTEDVIDSDRVRSVAMEGEGEESDVFELDVSLSCLRPGPSATVIIPCWSTAQRVTCAWLMTDES